MDAKKVVAAVETTAKNNGIFQADLYRESRALYHAIIEALHGLKEAKCK